MEANNKDTATASACQTSFLEACPDVVGRFDTIKRLADGYFHDIRGLLSVIMGQAGLLDSLATRPHRERSAQAIQSGTIKIEKAADELALYLTQLRELCTVGEDDMAETVTARHLIAALPAIIRGYNRQIKDTKNISFDFHVDDTGGDAYVIARRDIFDYVFRFLTSLMNEAICSGAFAISIDTREDVLNVRFDSNLIGHLGLDELVNRLFGGQSEVNEDRSPCRVPSATLQIAYGTVNDTTCEVSFPIVHRKPGGGETEAAQNSANGNN